DRGVLAVAQGTEAGHLDRLAPDAVLLDGDETLEAGRGLVVPAGRAVARRGARHREDVGKPEGQCPQAGHLDRRAPDAVLLADDEPKVVGVIVGPAGAAAARR